MRRARGLVFGLVLLSACSSHTPPIARGLPKSFGPTADFDRRVKQQFIIGSDETKLLAELRTEGFTITEIGDPSNRYKHSALFESTHFPCKETWKIRWTGDRGMIQGVEGSYSGELCF
jgi:hypothetical protein